MNMRVQPPGTVRLGIRKIDGKKKRVYIHKLRDGSVKIRLYGRQEFVDEDEHKIEKLHDTDTDEQEMSENEDSKE